MSRLPAGNRRATLLQGVPARFVRVHRSYVVNLDRIRAIEQYSKNSHLAILADGSRVQVSREGYARLQKARFRSKV